MDHRPANIAAVSADLSSDSYALVTSSARGERKDYRLERVPIGDGGQAEVLRGEHKETGTQIAFKRLKARDTVSVARMRREIEAARRFGSHPNVMPILDADRDSTWFVMPLAQGTASKSPVDLADSEHAEQLIRAICAALIEPHRQGWVHRDLKPDNILFLDGVWKVADWGLGRRPRGQTSEQRHTVVGGRYGTEGFAAPEMADNAHDVGPQADVYSIGQIAGWALAGGQWPKANIPLLPEAEPWRRLVREMTALNQAERPADANELLALVTMRTAAFRPFESRIPFNESAGPQSTADTDQGRDGQFLSEVDAVVAEVFRRADDLNWNTLSTADRGQLMTAWAGDPAFRDALGPRYKSADRVRMWLRNMVMPEYERAKHGFGKYVRLTRTRYITPAEMVAAACGAEWTVQPDSAGEKPLHCVASNGELTRYVCWGPERSLQKLTWTAMESRRFTSRTPIVVVYRYEDQAVPSEARRLEQFQTAASAGVELMFMTWKLVPNERFDSGRPAQP